MFLVLRSLRPVLAAVIGLALGCSGALAQLQVDRIEVDLLAGADYRGDVAVTNASGDETAFVQVVVFEVLNPGTPQEQRVERADPEAAGLLAAPRQLVLAPGQTKLVRLVATAPPEATDRVYRVQILPVVGEVLAEGMVVKVVVGYDMLVIARPDGAQPRIVGERQGRRLLLRNEGSTTGYLLRGTSCQGDSGPCAELPSRRMYPGNEFVVELPYQGPVTYQLGVGLQEVELRF